MRKILLTIICLSLSSCANDIYNYDLATPAKLQEATGTGVALMKKGEELTDAYIQAIREETCKLDVGFREYIKKRHEEKFGIVYQDKFCGEVFEEYKK